jgi:tripartite-type tricarboxylate transporter receptor subunit TctC
LPTVYPRAPYDTAGDFAAVVSLGTSPNVLVVSPAKGFKTAHDLVAAAKARPGALNFVSAGVGTATHLSAERFRMAAGFEAVHIPFRGGAEAITEVLSGRADFLFTPVAIALPHVRAGNLVAIAVSSPKRAVLLPDVPSVLELFPNSDYPFWIGIFMPVKTPRDIIEKFHRGAVETMQFPNVKERLQTLGMEPMPLTPAEFDARVRARQGGGSPAEPMMQRQARSLQLASLTLFVIAHRLGPTARWIGLLERKPCPSYRQQRSTSATWLPTSRQPSPGTRNTLASPCSPTPLLPSPIRRD